MRTILITSSVLILVLIVLRYLLRSRISLRLQYALWLLVLVSLPGTVFSILNFLPPEAKDTTVYVSSQGLTTIAPAPERSPSSGDSGVPGAGVPIPVGTLTLSVGTGTSADLCDPRLSGGFQPTVARSGT